ncbi:MAG: ABC transporter permease [Gemmatimonadetes bacterium]|nr:ABC transporter permease [Gemmatimonadota bacterium]
MRPRCGRRTISPTDPRARPTNSEAIGRLRDGATIEQARAELDAIQRRIRQAEGTEVDAEGVRVVPLRTELYGEARRPLVLLAGAALLVLLAACANLAGAWFGRSLGRGGEMAVRVSLGATRGRLVRQLLTEGLLVGLAGAVAGIGLASSVLRTLKTLAPQALDIIPGGVADVRLLAFGLLLTIVVTPAFALQPALRLSRVLPIGLLREAGRGGGGRTLRTSFVLVAVEVTVSFVLLAGSLLLLGSVRRLMDQELGFETRGVLTADVSLPPTVFPNDTTLSMAYDRLLSDLSVRPGIAAVGLINHVPLGGASISGSMDIEGRGETDGEAAYRVVSEGYFEVLSIRLVRGRMFGPGDRLGTPTVALVNRALADRFFAGDEVIGKRVQRLRNDSFYYDSGDWITIIGVVDNVLARGPRAPAVAEIYVHYRQRAFRARDGVIVVAPDADTRTAAASVRAALHEVSAHIPFQLGTLDARRAGVVSEERFGMLVLGSFAVIAVVLAAVGIHGVVAQALRARLREMGIRFALGATRAGVLGPALRAVVLAIGIGMVLGIVLAFWSGRALRGMLYGASGADPITLLAVTILILAAAAVATLGPAVRTLRSNPLDSLRTE